MDYLMIAHITLGTLAILAGFVAMCAPKGKRVHRKAGLVYLITMLGMATAGGAIAAILPQAINVFASSLTCYLVLTSWHAGRAKSVGRNGFEIIACVFICILAFMTLKAGYDVTQSEQQHLHGFGADAYFTIGGMALIAAIADLVMLAAGGASGKHRIIRHIWRMCLSYFIAAGSLFEGPGVPIFPQVVQDSGVLAIPVPLVMLFSLYWLIKTGFPKLRVLFWRN